jgi:predicted RNase H-like HicB family nuclease
MWKTFTVVVHEVEEGGYWGECLELDCASQGEDLDEMDHNIRESIEAVLAVRFEDGDDLAAIEKATQIEFAPTDRKWEISVSLPSAVAA